jgi:hypothetical protein
MGDEGGGGIALRRSPCGVVFAHGLLFLHFSFRAASFHPLVFLLFFFCSLLFTSYFRSSFPSPPPPCQSIANLPSFFSFFFL